MRFLNMPGALTVFGLLEMGVAHAEPRGLVVRVDLKSADATTGAVVVHLKSSTATKDVKVFDDGASPDVTAADQVYSGTTWVEADSFDVSVSIGTTKLTGGAVSWQGSDSARDLSISVNGKTLTAEAAVPTKPLAGSPAEAGVTQDGQGPPPLGDVAAGTPGDAVGSGAPPGKPGDGSPPPGPPGDPGGAPIADPGATAPGVAGAPPVGATSPGGAPTGGPMSGPMSLSPPASKDGTSPLLYIGFGVGVLLLTWLLASNLRSRSSGTDLSPLAEPGLFGPTTPSLSGGAAVWEAAGADANALGDALIATLARHRRVVVATSGGYTPAAVFGGPVYRVDDLKPAAIAKFVDAVEEDGGLPVVVLFRGPIDPAGVAALVKALPDGVGPVVVTEDAGDVKVPVVQCRRVSDGWVFVTPAGEVHTRAGADGLTALA